MGVLESKVPLDEQIMKDDLVSIRSELKGETNNDSSNSNNNNNNPTNLAPHVATLKY